MKRSAGSGFTLIELLISIALMSILLFAVTTVFFQTTDTVTISEARTQIYTQARYALEYLDNDLLSCVGFNQGIQNFWMENGRTGSGGGFPVYNVTGEESHLGQAADRISFIATTTAGDATQTAQITYELVPMDQAVKSPAPGVSMGIGPEGSQEVGGGKKTNITERPLYALVRRARVADPTVVVPPGELPKYELPPLDRQGMVVADMDLCRYVLSFNLEYLDDKMKFSQLEPSPFRKDGTPGGGDDPLGNGKGKNDGDPTPAPGAPPTALRVPYIRVTIAIVEDISERQERVIQKAIWVPAG